MSKNNISGDIMKISAEEESVYFVYHLENSKQKVAGVNVYV